MYTIYTNVHYFVINGVVILFRTWHEAAQQVKGSWENCSLLSDRL